MRHLIPVTVTAVLAARKESSPGGHTHCSAESGSDGGHSRQETGGAPISLPRVLLVAVVTVIVGLLLLVALGAAIADAQEDDLVWAKKKFCHYHAWDGTCAQWRWRKYRVQRHHRYHEPRQHYRDSSSDVRHYRSRDYDDGRGWEYRDPRSERGIDCKSFFVRVVGAAALSDEAATRAAVRSWQSTVAYDMGQKYMELANARDYRFRCDRASSNESPLGKLGELVAGDSATQKRCVVIARPCMMPMQEAKDDERSR